MRLTLTREITFGNVTINNNDISNTVPKGIFYMYTFSGGTIILKNVTIKNSDIGVKPVFYYNQFRTGHLTAEDFIVQNVALGS